MFENFKNLASMMGQAKQIRQKMEELQARLAERTAEGDAGAGAVRVTVNGKLEVLRVEVDRPLVAALAGQGSDADQAMVEELIAAACNAALTKAREMMQEELREMTGGMNLPGMPDMSQFLGQ
ncbi:MAG: YbaB/EbfC family nucleoid-associated protein [Phycisphaeraceae bacterium]|nr:YbaB/EbfC family nucleoid-associated protein [Phycisphaeraceae bacterium]